MKLSSKDRDNSESGFHGIGKKKWLSHDSECRFPMWIKGVLLSMKLKLSYEHKLWRKQFQKGLSSSDGKKIGLWTFWTLVLSWNSRATWPWVNHFSSLVFLSSSLSEYKFQSVIVRIVGFKIFMLKPYSLTWRNLSFWIGRFQAHKSQVSGTYL